MNPEYDPVVYGDVQFWRNPVDKTWLICREFSPDEWGPAVYQYFMPNGNPSGHWTWISADALKFHTEKEAMSYWMERVLTS